ncbi:hypothetical protein RCH22_000972 [Cryobacterium psychrotolerans]|nr:hypothetical protein [Cryobacterium psychrotolerans]MEC5149253.1 hypothetical protein [Cryobacterium psychrotolerans]MEC5149331.1 hypothetical protein [Cryobacterium psychrotolerans]
MSRKQSFRPGAWAPSDHNEQVAYRKYMKALVRATKNAPVSLDSVRDAFKALSLAISRSVWR